jgi:hypothetical protein
MKFFKITVLFFNSILTGKYVLYSLVWQKTGIQQSRFALFIGISGLVAVKSINL